MINRALITQPKNTISEPEQFWQAVLARDNRFDGRFVFAVQSTGIYCRPSCPARRARRDRVLFFQLPEAAEQAGYRACRRCKPQVVQIKDPQAVLVKEICRYLQVVEDKVSLSDLSRRFGISQFHLQRTFKTVMGITPRQFVDAQRMERFKEGVRAGNTIAEATYDSGFGSSSRIYERTGSALGMTPATYGRGGEGAFISYTIVPCSLGQLLVAATLRGICSVKLGDAEEGLETDLLSEYPRANIQRDDGRLKKSVAAVLDHLDGKLARLDLPLDIRSTAFQRRVWQELRTIPYGETRSYADVAAALGQPRAVRAVARACATNPVALVVPCHRVIGKDQKMTGYRWGRERKRALLEREGLKSTKS